MPQGRPRKHPEGFTASHRARLSAARKWGYRKVTFMLHRDLVEWLESEVEASNGTHTKADVLEGALIEAARQAVSSRLGRGRRNIEDFHQTRAAQKLFNQSERLGALAREHDKRIGERRHEKREKERQAWLRDHSDSDVDDVGPVHSEEDERD